ncbi:MAG: hypothetical protein R2939_14995 [Kofleriaceae bacterium]
MKTPLGGAVALVLGLAACGKAAGGDDAAPTADAAPTVDADLRPRLTAMTPPRALIGGGGTSP